jgi:hypothetical protein
MLKSARKPPLNRALAETVAAQGLAFLAEDVHQLQHFLAVTGLEPADLRARAGTREVLCAVLAFLAADESLLLSFAANSRVAPETLSAALTLLDEADAD